MSRISSFIKKHPEQAGLIKEVLDLYEKDRYEWEQDRCQVCREPLTPEEQNSISPNHFWRTCMQHRSFAAQFQLGLSVVQKRPSLKDFLFGNKIVQSGEVQ